MNPRCSIQTENLRRHFGTVRAVDGITLAVPPGIVFGFLGPNGSGKTTTIRLLLGLLEPSDGRAEVLGFDVTRHADSVRALTGALLEHHGLYERLTAQDNLEYYGRIYRLAPAQRQARIEELIRHMGLWERRREPVGRWSRGMKQKLAIARALLHRPPLIFLDEPTAGLDPMAAAALREDIAALAKREGTTVFLTTHNLTEAEKLCDLVGVISAGQLLAAGHPDTLRTGMGTPRVEVYGSGFTDSVLSDLRANPDIASAAVENQHLVITLKQAVDTAPLVSYLVRAGVRVEEVRKGSASLEDVFLRLVQEEGKVA